MWVFPKHLPAIGSLLGEVTVKAFENAAYRLGLAEGFLGESVQLAKQIQDSVRTGHQSEQRSP